ncbi:pilus assembly protein PilM [Omnitrophica bacterium]|nr:pilus assembly protein PilM [Candidatus Omnitrophota bacterium]
MGNRELVGIDFSGNNLKIAGMKISAGKRELVNILTDNISGLDDADISKVIKASFAKLKIKNPYIVNTIPSHMIITKNIEIPSTNPQEIQEIINLQASRYTPYSREEIVVDYVDIDTYKNNYTKILLVIVARNVVKRQFEILNKAGIKLEKVTLAPESLAWSVPKILRLDTGTSPVSVIHIDDAFSDFIIISRNKPTFIRSISIGAQQLTEEKEAFGPKFIDEIKKSFEAYQSEDIEKGPRSLIMAGATEELKDLKTYLGNTLPLEVSVMDYFKSLSISKETLEAQPKAGRLSFFNVIASLLACNEVKVNLVPAEIRLRKSVEERGKDLIKTGILLLAIFILVFSILISKIYFKSTYLATIKTRYERLHREAEKLEGQFEKVTMIRDYLSKRGHSLEVLTELHDAAPIELELNDIRFEQGGKFTVKGTARSMSTVFSFVDNMEKSEYFRDVKTRYTTKRKDGKKDVTDFEVNCFLNTEGD